MEDAKPHPDESLDTNGDSEGSASDSENRVEESGAAEAERKLVELIRAKLPDEQIEPDQLAQLIAHFVAVEVRESTQFQGPLPPPKMLAEYEQTLSGLADRIVERAEREQKFRHEATLYDQQTTRKAINYDAAKTFVGQACAFILAFLSIGGGVWLVHNGHSAKGLATVISTLVALVAVFITGKFYESKSPNLPDERSEGFEEE